MSLALEKETLRTLSGPEVTMVTHLEPMQTPALEMIHGGGPVSEAVSNIISGVASFSVSAAISATDSIPTDEGPAAVSGAAISLAASGNISDAISDWFSRLLH